MPEYMWIIARIIILREQSEHRDVPYSLKPVLQINDHYNQISVLIDIMNDILPQIQITQWNLTLTRDRHSYCLCWNVIWNMSKQSTCEQDTDQRTMTCLYCCQCVEERKCNENLMHTRWFIFSIQYLYSNLYEWNIYFNHTSSVKCYIIG